MPSRIVEAFRQTKKNGMPEHTVSENTLKGARQIFAIPSGRLAPAKCLDQ